jgi:hypothetical protein
VPLERTKQSVGIYGILALLSWSSPVAYRGEGVSNHPPKFWSFDKAELNSQFHGNYIRNNPQHPKNLTKSNRIANWAEPQTRELPPPDPCSLCPLSSTEFVEPPLNKIPGYATEVHCYAKTTNCHCPCTLVFTAITMWWQCNYTCVTTNHSTTNDAPLYSYISTTIISLFTLFCGLKLYEFCIKIIVCNKS